MPISIRRKTSSQYLQHRRVRNTAALTAVLCLSIAAVAFVVATPWVVGLAVAVAAATGWCVWLERHVD
jgi:hypothetical protein